MRLLAIGGLDSCGRAGLDADRDAATAFDVECAAIATAHTRQDEDGFHALGARPARDWFEEALEALEHEPAALKFGLLPGAAHITAAADLVSASRARTRGAPPVVVDPVVAATSGFRFLDDAARRQLLEALVPQGVVLTPNLPEAAWLLDRSPEPFVHQPEARTELARAFLDLGARAVALKGGHGSEDPVRDLVLEQSAEPVWLEHPRHPGPGIGGSGCRFATALAARLAQGTDLPTAVRAAGDFVAARIRTALRPDLTQGPA